MKGTVFELIPMLVACVVLANAVEYEAAWHAWALIGIMLVFYSMLRDL